MKKIPFLLLIAGLYTFSIQLITGQTWDWGAQFSGNGNVTTVDIVTDASGNVYVAGTYDTDDVTIGTDVLTFQGGTDVFISSFTSSGTFRWAKSISGIGTIDVQGIDIDDSGNLYIVGGFKDENIHFTASDSLENYNHYDSYLAQYNNSGTLQYATRIFWGTNQERIQDIVVDQDNSVLAVCGVFKAELIYFDGTTDQTIASVGPKDQVVATISFGGIVQNIATFETSVVTTTSKTIAVCNSGGYFIGGDLEGTIYFPTSLTGDGGNTDIMVFRVDNNLNYLWGRVGKGIGFDHVNAMTADPYSNVYLTGKTESDPTTFDSTATLTANPLPGNGGSDMYLAKYNRDGNLQWARRKGNTGDDDAFGLASFENLVQFSGIYSGQVIFNNDTLDSGSPTNINTGFATFDNAGREIGGQEITGDLVDQGTGVAFDVDGKTLISGDFTSTSISAGTINFTNTNSPAYDGFLFKYSYPFSPAFTVHTNVTCNGGNDGELIVTPYFGVSPYTYSWDHDAGLTDSTATNLSAGDYSVLVTDGIGTQSTVYATITEPAPISVTGSVTNILCSGDNNGAISITVSGGTSPYSYLWSTKTGSGLTPTNKDQSGLTAGRYYIDITDDNGCMHTDSFDVTEPLPITLGNSTVTDILTPPGSNGAIDIVVDGGTSPYTFSWTGPNSFSSSSQSLSGLVDAGTYDLHIDDANTCTKDTSFVVSDNTAFVAFISTKQDVTCKSDNDGSATVSTTGGTGPYSYAWRDVLSNPIGGDNPTLSNVPAGTYYVTVTDNSDARTADATVDIAEPAQALSISLNSITDITCYGSSDGIIDIGASGGWGSYTYAWTGPSGFTATTEDITGLDAGFYSVTVTDGGGCITTLNNNEIQEPSVLNVTISINQDILCNGELSGELEANPTGGTTPYAYAWDDPGNQTTKRASYLQAGYYTVTLTDNNGCTDNASELLTEPSAISVSAIVSDVSCAGASDGYISLTVSGGTPPFSYLWSPNNEITKDISNLDGGDYSVTITDNNNCTWDSTFSVHEPAPLNIGSVNVTDITGCPGSTNGELVINATGGTAPLEYSIDNGTTYQSSNTFSNLGPGDYDVYIRDANGCSLAGSTYTLNDPPAVSIDQVNQTNLTCNASADGTIDITASGGTPPLTYSIDGGTTYQSASLFNSLDAGNYNIAVQDDNGCITNYGTTITLTEPGALVINSVSVTDISGCPGNTNGQLIIDATGGTVPLEYSIDNGTTFQSNNTFSNLGAGDYDVYIRDANGCTLAGSTYTLSDPPGVSIDQVNQTNLSCNASADGTIDITASGGTPPLTYSIDGGITYQSASLFTSLDAGDFDIVVLDDNGCITTYGTTITLTEPDALVINSVSVTDVTVCPGNTNGELVIHATGGISPFEYSIDNGTTFQSDSTFSNLGAGNYDVYIRDANSCTLSGGTYTLNDPPGVVIDQVDQTDISCNGSADGSIHIMASGGSTPYAYSIDGGTTFQSGSLFANLDAGNYDIAVQDNNGCIITYGTTITISEPDPLGISSVSVTDITGCSGSTTGELVIHATGGTIPLEYSIDGGTTFQADSTFSNLGAGSYDVYIRDANNCSLAGSTYTLNDPTTVTIDQVNQTNLSCNGSGDGIIEIIASNGAPPYAYSVDNGITYQANNIFSNLDAGNYDVTVQDNNGCVVNYGTTIILTEPVAMVIDSVSVTDITGCPGATNGELIIHASGGVPPFEYSVDGGSTYQTDSVFNGLAAGNYDISIRDANGCTLPGNTIQLNDPPSATIDQINQTNPTCNSFTDGTIEIVASGITTPFSYSIDGGTTYQAGNSFSNLAAGNYDISVKDNNDCVTTGNTISLTEPDAITISSVEITNTCSGDFEGEIVINASGGTGTLVYSLFDSLLTKLDSNDIGTFTGLDMGTYIVQVNDENLCGPISSNDIEIIEGDNCRLIIFNAFTPNGDNINDLWNIIGIQTYPNCTVQVFNTWGVLVFSSRGYPEPWDGTYNGSPLPAGTYYYVIDLGPGEKTYSGTVNIVK